MLAHPFKLLRPYKDILDVALLRKEDASQTDDNIAKKLGVSTIASLKQVHGNKVVIAQHAIDRTEEGDGLLTDIANLALTIRSADCQTFVVFAPEAKIVGSIHAGWKGLIAGIIPSFFACLKKEWDIHPKDTVVGAAPSLCLTCSEFEDPLHIVPASFPKYIHDTSVDLRAIAEDQLREIGVISSRFERLPGCTRCESDIYWSYRSEDKKEVKKGKTNILACVLRS